MHWGRALADVDDLPVDDLPVDDLPVDDLPVQLDPVADAMGIEPAPYEAPPAAFVIDDADGDLSMPDEPDLDDGF